VGGRASSAPPNVANPDATLKSFIFSNTPSDNSSRVVELIGLLSPPRRASLAVMDAKPMNPVHASVGEICRRIPGRSRSRR
jgi:hypothetical protein